MNINIIASVGKNYEIGYKNKLVCPIREDLIFFKNLTIYNTVLMGKNTYQSIGKELPNFTKTYNCSIIKKKMKGITLWN